MQELTNLLLATMSSSTAATYKRAFNLLREFQQSIPPHANFWPASEALITSFIAFLYHKDLAASTIATYISALGSLHKFAGFADPTSTFLVKKTLYGVQKTRFQKDSRLPITSDIINKLLNQILTASMSKFNKLLISAMFQVAFHVFLRIGEIVLRHPKQDPGSVMQACDISFFTCKNKITGFQLILRTWKHH